MKIKLADLLISMSCFKYRSNLKTEADDANAESKDDQIVYSYAFDDLGPIQDADKDKGYKHYAAALSIALEEDRIRNIAITGPYGSGKSSIIKTFEQLNTGKYKFLNISLASFDERPDVSVIPFTRSASARVENRLIERSILQQMLYGADANKLQYSRFKRIATPVKALYKSLFFVLGILITVFLLSEPSIFIKAQPFSLTYWMVVVFCTYSIVMLLVAVSLVYESTFGLAFKKLSLKNAEFEIGSLPDDSILNRHLDEIIYFFQVTNYDVVVIEDLDRFGSPEIFVKLREINKLINTNDKTSGKIKFVYALKDDMFANEDRAKFFEFIIPVVPIISSSNSLDKMQKRLRETKLESEIEAQFLRDVSLYINDMRLLKNIFNEFLIYVAQLSSENLDKTKLLAMMIYKNVYPSDFEKLHNSAGALFSISNLRNDLANQVRIELSQEITLNKQLLKDSAEEIGRSVDELVKSFFGHILVSSDKYTNQPVVGLVIGGEALKFSQVIDWAHLEKLFNEDNIHLAIQNYNNPTRFNTTATNKSFKEWEKEISPENSFMQRKNNIENIEEQQQKNIRDKIQSLESERLKVANLPLHKLLLNSEEALDKIVLECKVINGELLKYLVKEGYLDENYHLYTSNFHEGRLSAKDRDFLLTIRNYRTPDPLQHIDTPSEVCENMRATDFGQSYVLNVQLFNYLLENTETLSEKLNSALKFISENFTESEEFLGIYWQSGKHVKKLVEELSKKWSGYAVTAISSYQAPIHLFQILAHVKSDYIVKHMNKGGLLTEYFNQNISMIDSAGVQPLDNYSVFKKLNLKIQSMESIKENQALMDYIYQENLYVINPDNIGLLLTNYTSVKNNEFNVANFSTIQELGSESLKRYIDSNIQLYVDDVLLCLPDNTKENESCILQLLKNSAIDTDCKEQIISKQDHVFSTFTDIPVELWKHLLSEDKIIFSWRNISDYLSAYKNEEEKRPAELFVTELIQREHVLITLKDQKINIDELGKTASLDLSWFIINNDELEDINYKHLVQAVPYQYKSFPQDISENKLISLVEHRKVSLNEKSYEFAESNDELLSILIGKNIYTYQQNKELYPLNKTVLEAILGMQTIPMKIKVELSEAVTPDDMADSVTMADLLSEIFLSEDIDYEGYDLEVLTTVIVSSTKVENSIKILSASLDVFDKHSVIEILSRLPKPFKNIASFGRMPRLPITEDNLYLAQRLDDKNVISSHIVKDRVIKINTYSNAF